MVVGHSWEGGDLEDVLEADVLGDEEEHRGDWGSVYLEDCSQGKQGE